MAQGGDVARLQVLELGAGTAGVAAVGTYQQLHVHRQAEVVNHELQAAAQHFAFGQGLWRMEGQAPGGQVVNLHLVWLAVAVQVAQFGGDAHPGMLALRFGFMHDIDVHGGIHGDIRSCYPIRGLTRP